MGEIIAQLGVDWRLILAQLFNLILLLIVLERFVYRPVLKVIDARREQIKENEEREKRLEKKLSGVDSIKEKIVAEAREEAEKVRTEALERTEEAKEHILATAKKEAETLVDSQRRSFDAEIKRLEESIQSEIGEAITRAIEKSVGETLGKDERAKILEQSLQRFSEEYKGSQISAWQNHQQERV